MNVKRIVFLSLALLVNFCAYSSKSKKKEDNPHSLNLGIGNYLIKGACLVAAGAPIGYSLYKNSSEIPTEGLLAGVALYGGLTALATFFTASKYNATDLEKEKTIKLPFFKNQGTSFYTSCGMCFLGSAGLLYYALKIAGIRFDPKNYKIFLPTIGMIGSAGWGSLLYKNS